jgi:hypothetical protein
MPSLECSAKVDNYSKGTVTFEWEFYVRYNIYRHLFKTDDTLCSRIAMVKFADTTFAENNETTSWTNDFNVNALDSLLFVGKYYTCDDTIRTWEFGDYIFTGGWIWIQATAKNSRGKIIAFKQQSGGQILGLNANSNTMINFAEPKEFKAIIKHESSFGDGIFAQFNIVDKDQRYKLYGYRLEGWKYNRRGYPRYGVPNGFGLAQIDKQPYPNEMDLWNWKYNINDGRTRYEDGLNAARTYLNSFKQEYSNEILLMNAYQNYNTGGFYHEWDYKKQEWTSLSYLKDKNGKINEDKNYGGKVINVYNSLP